MGFKPISPESDRLDLYLEALIFASEVSLSLDDLQRCSKLTFGQTFERDHLLGEIKKIKIKYDDDNHAIQLLEIADGYTFMTKPAYHKIIGDYLRSNEKKKLTRASMETLSIIAYKQPVTKSTIEQIRGVNSDYSVQKLLDKELVEITGREEGPGRPLLYGTTRKFLDHFGLKNAKDLPQLKEMEAFDNTIGQIEKIED